MPTTNKHTVPGCCNSIPKNLERYVNNASKKTIYNSENLRNQTEKQCQTGSAHAGSYRMILKIPCAFPFSVKMFYCD